MAQLDEYIEMMSQRGAYYMKLVSDKPVEIRVGQQVEAGSTISRTLLEDIAREIVPQEMLPRFGEQGTLQFQYESLRGALTIDVTRKDEGLELTVSDWSGISTFLNSRVSHEEEPETRECPHCNGEVETDDIRCPHCRKWLIESVPPLMMTIGEDKEAVPIRDPDDQTIKRTLRSLDTSGERNHITIEFEGGDDYLMIWREDSDSYYVDYDGEDIESGYTKTEASLESVMSCVRAYRKGEIDTAPWDKNDAIQPSGASTLLLTTEDGEIRNPDEDACRKALDAMRKYNRTLNYSHSIKVSSEDVDGELEITKVNSDQFNVEFTPDTSLDDSEVEFRREGVTKAAVVAFIEEYRRGQIKEWLKDIESSPSPLSSSGYSSAGQASGHYFPQQVGHPATPSQELTPQQIAGHQAQTCLGVMQMGCGCIGLIFFLFLAFLLFSLVK